MAPCACNAPAARLGPGHPGELLPALFGSCGAGAGQTPRPQRYCRETAAGESSQHRNNPPPQGDPAPAPLPPRAVLQPQRPMDYTTMMLFKQLLLVVLTILHPQGKKKNLLHSARLRWGFSDSCGQKGKKEKNHKNAAVACANCPSVCQPGWRSCAQEGTVPLPAAHGLLQGTRATITTASSRAAEK